MGIFDFFLKKLVKQPTLVKPPIQTEQETVSVKIDYGKSTKPTVKVQTPEETYECDLDIEYVCISTSGDENVCPMCVQFEGKFFLASDAPELPLCPSCSCAYEYYSKNDLPAHAIISDKNNFVLPAKCTKWFYKKQQETYEETDINKLIRLCESQLKRLHEFIQPYIAANFDAPAELACRDLLPELYMQTGEWEKAEKTIKTCILEKAYDPEDSSDVLADFEAYRKVAIETLTYISQNPGCLQRNIYKKMGYEGIEREKLKDFIRDSRLIRKVKYNNTNQLFCVTEKS